MKIKDVLRISIVNTLRFNFKYFDFFTAIKFPAILSSRIKIVSLKGQIVLNTPVKFGVIYIKSSELNINGKWIVNGRVRFKGGTEALIYISAAGVLETGNDFFAHGPVAINCQKSIKFGNNCLLAHKIELLDTDFHQILNLNGVKINDDREITIGDRVWIGSNTLILKGTTIASDTIIGAGSVLTKAYNTSNCVYAGNPAKLVKSNISWDY